jgi:acyl phosphate:glycerol-3-phosphate acyltransferase
MDSLLNTVLWVAAAYLLGAIPFSALLIRWFTHTDFRQIGDGNPGAANAWKAGSWRIGIPALLLDYLKGAVPVALAHYVYGFANLELVAVAIAPVLGHAWSMLLGFRGGKALAVTFGIWTGLTLWQAPVVLGLLFVLGIVVLKDHARTVIVGMIGLLIFLLLRGADPTLLITWAVNVVILALKHGAALGHRPHVLDALFTPSRRS